MDTCHWLFCFGIVKLQEHYERTCDFARGFRVQQMRPRNGRGVQRMYRAIDTGIFKTIMRELLTSCLKRMLFSVSDY